MRYQQPKQGGFSLISALFVVVVLALLGGFISTLSIVQHGSSALSVATTRAWFSAMSGLEWSINRILTTGSCPTVPSSFSVDDFSVSLQECTQYPSSGQYTEGTDNFNVFFVKVLASRGTQGTMDYVVREVESTIKGP